MDCWVPSSKLLYRGDSYLCSVLVALLIVRGYVHCSDIMLSRVFEIAVGGGPNIYEG